MNNKERKKISELEQRSIEIMQADLLRKKWKICRISEKYSTALTVQTYMQWEYQNERKEKGCIKSIQKHDCKLSQFT